MADQSGFVYFQDLYVGTLHLNMSCGFTQKGLVTLALHPLAHQLANATSRFGGFAGAALGRLFIRTAVLHLAEHAFALQLLFQNAQRLFNIVVSYGYVHGESLPLSRRCLIAQACRLETCAANNRKTGIFATESGV